MPADDFRPVELSGVSFGDAEFFEPVRFTPRIYSPGDVVRWLAFAKLTDGSRLPPDLSDLTGVTALGGVVVVGVSASTNSERMIKLEYDGDLPGQIDAANKRVLRPRASDPTS
jgi:hypothetical protein